MSGSQSLSQVRRWSSRCLIELTFHVATRIKKAPSVSKIFVLWHTMRGSAVITV
jgi:hypothetical protein